MGKKVAVLFSVLFLVSVIGVSASALTPNEQLGKSIFFDDNLSINMNQSCAACHAPESGWTGPNSAINALGSVYEGSIPTRFGNRKPPSSAYATLSPILHYWVVDRKEPLFIGGNFWDGRATGERLGNPAADQAGGPFLNPLEQASPDKACIVYKVCNPVIAYPVSFESVWGAGACDIAWPTDIDSVCATEGGYVSLSPSDRDKSAMSYDNIALSIATYEDSPEVNAFTSKYDLSLMDMAKLSKQERKGFALFQGKGKCARCHISSGPQPLFTDFTYDNLGLPKNPDNPFYYADPTFNTAGYDWIDEGLGGFLFTRGDYSAYADANYGKQKVPTLRNVDKWDTSLLGSKVKAYGHNGYFKSLEGIVHFYNTRDVLPVCPDDYTEADALHENCWPSPEVPENVNTSELGDLGLTPKEEAAIVAFLTTLSDGYVP
jgi:cytochrome c peroxidase